MTSTFWSRIVQLRDRTDTVNTNLKDGSPNMFGALNQIQHDFGYLLRTNPLICLFIHPGQLVLGPNWCLDKTWCNATDTNVN